MDITDKNLLVDAGTGIMLVDPTHKRSSGAIQNQTNIKGRGGTMSLFPLTSTPIMWSELKSEGHSCSEGCTMS
jgi:hypothetical protein